MKILISLSYYLPNISGLTNYAKILAEELFKRGYDITIITSQHEKNLLPYENQNGIKIVRIPITFKIGKGPIMLSLPFKIGKYITGADVINCHLPQFESFILAFLAKAKHKKLILTYQTDLSWDGELLLKISKVFILFSHFISALLADTIVVLNKDYARHSWFLSLFSKKLSYIYPPVKLIEPDKTTSKLFKKRMQLKQRYILGIVARISPEKGIEYLLEAIPYLRNKLGSDFIIVIVGPPKPIGEYNYIRKIDTLLKKYNKFVKFLGRLSDKELTCLYKSLDILVLPSINSTEAFGMVQVEAILCGVPVIATDLPGVRVPIITTGMGELAKPKNSRDLAEKIVKILKNKKKYIKKREFIKNIFSSKLTISEYEKLFK